MTRTGVATIAPDRAGAAPTHPLHAHSILLLLQPDPRSIRGGAPDWIAQYSELTPRSVFQPVMTMTSTRIIGYEALVHRNVGADAITSDEWLARAIQTCVHDAIPVGAGTGRY